MNKIVYNRVNFNLTAIKEEKMNYLRIKPYFLKLAESRLASKFDN